MLKKSDLKGHQRLVSEFIVNTASTGGCMCWLDVGGGKTSCTLDALSELSKMFCFNKALVVSTKRIVMDVWPSEIRNWEQSKDMRIVTREQLLDAKNIKDKEYLAAKKKSRELSATIKRKGVKRVGKEVMSEFKRNLNLVRTLERNKILALEGDIYLINVENYQWLVDTLGSKWIFDTQIFDESSLFRNNTSKRFKAAKRIRPHSTTTIELTGTPAPNGYEGLWSQVYLIDGGKRLGKTITQYRDKYFDKAFHGFGYTLKRGAEPLIQEKIKDIIISLDPRDYMEIGEKAVHNNIVLELPDKLRTQYRQLESEFFLEIEGNPIIAPTEAVKSSKLRQFCNGSIYSQDILSDKRTVVDVHDLKMEVLADIVETSAGNPLIVAYEFILEKERILKKYPKAMTIGNFSQKKWDKGEVDMLLLHPKSGGHGLNLQHGGHRVVWFPTMIDLELFNQLSGRIGELRQAQSGYYIAPIYYHIYFKDTVEEDLIKRRGKKDLTQKELIRAIQEGVTRRSRGVN